MYSAPVGRVTTPYATVSRTVRSAARAILVGFLDCTTRLRASQRTVGV